MQLQILQQKCVHTPYAPCRNQWIGSDWTLRYVIFFQYFCLLNTDLIKYQIINLGRDIFHLARNFFYSCSTIRLMGKFWQCLNYSLYQFQTLVIAAPAVAAAASTDSGSAAGDCATDSFSVSAGGGGRSSPIICGTNTGQHGEYRARDLRLMWISLLQFFKTFHEYLAYAFFWLFISLVRFRQK